MGIGVEDVNKARIWLGDAEAALGRGRVETARALYNNSLLFLRNYETAWIALAQLEMHHGSAETLDDVLKRVRAL